MKILNYSFVFILLLSSLAHAQDKKNFKKYFVQGEYHFFLEEYDEALSYYTMLLDMDQENYHVLYLAGECYLNLPGRKTRAIPYLEQAIGGMSEDYKEGSYKERNAPNEALYSLARAYQVNSQFQKAHDYYIQYGIIMTDRSYADHEYVNKQIESCLAAGQMMAAAGNIEFVPMESELPLSGTGYNPVVCSNDSVTLFMNDDEGKRSIYMVRLTSGSWSEPLLINRQLGAIDDCLITCISSDGKELYMTRSDKLDSDIYVSNYNGDQWTGIRPVKGKVNSSYYESHASLSGDGQTLYFTSNRKGGYGALDIYRVERLEPDDWGPAENLGGIINTAYNEESPFVTEDGTRLYFSSQGHQTMGGYDVFYCRLLSDGSWSSPMNLGYPLNSGDDEVFYVPVNNGEDGIMASARGREQQGIYRVKYLSDEEVAERRKEETAVAETTPERTVVEAPADRNLITVKSIMFDYKSEELNQKALSEVENIYRIMRDFPDITLEVTAYTDSKGSKEYNRNLSERRARSVVSALEKKGIEGDRLIARGGGESGYIAINENPDGTDNPEGRKLNRHARIRFMNFENENISIEEINVPEHLRPRHGLKYTILLAELDERDTDAPREIGQLKVQEIESGQKYLYLAGSYEQKSDAVEFLNSVVDEGYPGASIIEKTELDKRIRMLSTCEATSGEQTSREVKRYTIQIMALKNERDVSFFKDLPGLQRIDGSDGIYRYVFGEYGSVKEAMDKLPEVRALGYKDAFIWNMKNYK